MRAHCFCVVLLSFNFQRDLSSSDPGGSSLRKGRSACITRQMWSDPACNEAVPNRELQNVTNSATWRTIVVWTLDLS